jgi:hypothetical protein
MSTFSKALLSALHDSKMLGVRAGKERHRFTGIWVVVVRGRVFVRSWNDEPGGWRKKFLSEKDGYIQIDHRELTVLAKKVRGEKLLKEIDRAYAEKYKTKASQKWVRGLNTVRRKATTTEFVPLPLPKGK